MQILKPILIICLISCSNQKPSQTSYWQTQKSSFKYQDKTEFVIDSSLYDTYKQLPKTNHPLFTKNVNSSIYLYSWQNRDKKSTEFTIIEDNGEHGLRIIYFIIDKRDSLISSEKVAGRSGEGGFLFEAKSKFLNKDTLLNISSATWMHDGEERLKKPIGDSTFSYLIIDKKGKVEKTSFREVKDLQFDKIME